MSLHKFSTEILVHFQCGECKKWWTIGDAPIEKTEWVCPWCGALRKIESINSTNNNLECRQEK